MRHYTIFIGDYVYVIRWKYRGEWQTLSGWIH
jgi:ribosomal protein L24